MNLQAFLRRSAAAAAVIGLGLFLAACGTTPSGAGGGAGGDTSAGKDSGGGLVLDPSKCGKFDDGTYGKKVPWQGWQGEGKTISCNVCRGGYKNFQGAWRFIDFKTEDPATPLGDGVAELLTIDGNTFVDRITGPDPDKQADQTTQGYYFCGDAAEIPSMDAVFVIQKATPDGAFGNKTGGFFRASVKSGQGNDNLIALGLSEGLTGKLIGEFIYCKVGSTIAGHPCSDPFQK